MADFFQGSGSLYKTDLFNIFNVVQNTQLSYPKQLIIGMLRDVFSLDTYYHYVRDPWGFPLTPDHTDLPSDSGINNDLTTRIYIGEKFRNDIIYYPAIIIRNGGTSYVPISMNREKETVQYSLTTVTDGYGNQKLFSTPESMIFAGAWEGTITADIFGRGIREGDDIAEIVSSIGVDWRFEELLRAGVLIKKVSVGTPTEAEDRNDKLYKVTVSFEIRSEWRRLIPIENVVDAINICVDFGHTNIKTQEFEADPNLEIHTFVSLIDNIGAL